MALNLRLTPQLDADLRAAADWLGVSLNAFICVALDAYLRGAVQKPVESVYSASIGQPTTIPTPKAVEASRAVSASPAVLPAPREPLSKDQLRGLMSRDRRARKKGR